jgi:hypothetical protein
MAVKATRRERNPSDDRPPANGPFGTQAGPPGEARERAHGGTQGEARGKPHDQPYERTVSGNAIIAVCVAFFAGVLLLNVVSARHNQQRNHNVRDAARLVDDPALVRQQWQLTANGAVWRVEATDSGDATKRASLLRVFVREREKDFLEGDYSDPAFRGLPADGRAELETAGKRGTISIRLERLPKGAQLIWKPDAASVVAPLHAWVRNLVAAGPAELVP